MPKAEDMIREGAAEYLEAGEEFLGGAVVQARGHTQAVAGVESLGQSQEGKVASAAGQAGFPVENPMGLALTNKRLLALSVKNPVGMGIGGKVTGLLGSVPLSDVDSIEAKRLLVGHRLLVTVRGVLIKLEAGAGAKVKPLAEAFQQVKPA